MPAFPKAARRPSYTLVVGAAAALVALLVPGSRTADAVERQAGCWETKGSRQNIVHISGDDLLLRLSSGDCKTEMRVQGEVRFTDDFRGIASLSREGRVRIVEEDRRGDRRLDIRPSDGGLAYEYLVDGRERPFDADGREWLAETLTEFFRNTSYAAEERAAWLYGRGGADAVLREVEELSSTAARRAYLELVLRRRGGDVATARRVLEVAGRTLGSSSQLGQLLRELADVHTLEGAMGEAFFDALGNVSSSSARASALRAAVQAPGASPALLARAAREAESISSSSAQRDVLTAILRRSDGDAAVLEAVLRSADGISSSSSRGDVLAEAAAFRLVAPELQRAYLYAVDGISGSSARRRALERLVAKEVVRPEELALALTAARGISSSSELAELLVTIARTHASALERGPLRDAYLDAARSVSSRTQRDRALAALVHEGSL